MSYEGTGVPLSSIVQFLDEFAPKGLAEKWDNTGLLVEPFSNVTINNILLTNDLTEDVMKEAIQLKANFIVSYHPPIFKPLTQITTLTWKERIIGACLENKIGVYSPHTRWDSVQGGVNDWLASAFECEYVKPIEIQAMTGGKSEGAGRYCKLKEAVTLAKAVNNLKNLILQPHLQIALARGASLESEINEIAICAGSGSTVLQNVPAALYITGEMSHHSLLEAIHNNASVILCNHSNSERGFLKYFQKQLDDKFGECNVKTHISREDRDPLQFV